MAPTLNLDRNHTAVLIMDYQNDIVEGYSANQPGILERASTILTAARDAGLPVIYVVVRFRDGYPEVSPRNRGFSRIGQTGRLQEGSAGAEIHPKVAPQQGDVIVTKRRVGAFSTTDLETVLRARELTTLVLMGIATSGVVLSTVRWAADADYELVVVEDCCADRDEEVHRVLTEKVFAGQTAVVRSADILEALAARA